MTSKTIKIASGINTLYILARENGQYSIICVEENLKDKTLEIHKSPMVCEKKRRARGFFKRLIKGKAFGYTLNDIMSDLLS